MFKHKELKPQKRDTTSADASTAPGYPYRLNFYELPPLFDVTLEDFEECAIDRLRILAEIESSYARNRSWAELREVTNKLCRKYLPMNANKTALGKINSQEQRKRDHLGHFVLRLAFCRSEELRRRFVKAETTLFRVRYEEELRDEREEFLKSLNFGWAKVDANERAAFEAELKDLEGKTDEQDSYVKVHWTKVPDLVAKRRVFLRGGFAYVSGNEISSIVYHEFEGKLQKALEHTAKMLPRMDEDTRLVPILNNLSQGFLAGIPSEWSNAPSSGDEVRAEMIDDMAKKHFPLCMRNLHECLTRDRHLKHFGRLQYGLFLKVLGLSIDEAILFWRKSFSNITDDKFNKEYKYNIRHSYGLEGKRANYPAKSCQQILTTDKPGVGDCHGCPYRHFSPENLQSSLLTHYSSQGLGTIDLHEIMRTVKDEHYHVACTRVFEITHASKGVKKGDGIGDGESVTHPNQYAARSIELEKDQSQGGTAMAVD
ncbi:DNA primase, large subunit [Pisolithus marmoratus]|nr:DNA primase, large subunit [Pisolithus marmoratus]